MPTNSIERKTSFIVEDELWYVVESDFSSVKGTMYLSLTEGKVNAINDDLVEDIADIDKMAKYEFITPEVQQTFNIGDIINLDFYLLKNGEKIEEDYTIISKNKEIVNDELIGVAAGEAELEVSLTQYPFVNTTITVEIGEIIEPYAYLVGNDSIKLDRESEYTLETNLQDYSVEFSLSDATKAIISSCADNTCIVHANNKNILGYVDLIATVNGQEYIKTIKITPLW